MLGSIALSTCGTLSQLHTPGLQDLYLRLLITLLAARYVHSTSERAPISIRVRRVWEYRQLHSLVLLSR